MYKAIAEILRMRFFWNQLNYSLEKLILYLFLFDPIRLLNILQKR